MQRGESKMSWGYVPKKLKKARRQKRLRKKYKNFSCVTCAYGRGCCPKSNVYYRALWHGEGAIIKNCTSWEASTEAKAAKGDANKASTTEKKQSRKGIFKRIFG